MCILGGDVFQFLLPWLEGQSVFFRSDWSFTFRCKPTFSSLVEGFEARFQDVIQRVSRAIRVQENPFPKIVLPEKKFQSLYIRKLGGCQNMLLENEKFLNKTELASVYGDPYRQNECRRFDSLIAAG